MLSAPVLYGSFAAFFAGLSGGCLAVWGMRRMRIRAYASANLKLSQRDRILKAARSMSRPIKPLTRVVLRGNTTREIANDARRILRIEEAIGAEEICGALLVVSGLIAMSAFLLTFSVAFAVAIACIVCVSACCWVRHAALQERQAMREAVPNAMRSLADSFRSGHSLMQTMQQASRESDGRLAHLFEQAANRLRSGETTSVALEPFKNESRVPELTFMAVALDIQHQSGGSIGPVLESARESVEEELELAQTLRVQTAQARLSATIVTIMPFLLVAFFSLASPDFLTPFFGSAPGIFLLIAALTMQLAGVMAVRRICKVDE